MTWKIVYAKRAVKDAGLIKQAGLSPKVLSLLRLLEEDPYRSPPRCEKLVGDVKGVFYRRINLQHRLLYQVLEEEHIVKVLRVWTLYD